MTDLEYTITKFDKELKYLVVTFTDNTWAEIRLSNPLPKNIEELEKIIKQFAAPKEAIEARLAPDADLSYIESLVMQPRTCERHTLMPEVTEVPEIEVDPELDEQLRAMEKVAFENKVKEILVSLNIIPAQA
jgi:hypothetical protein